MRKTLWLATCFTLLHTCALKAQVSGDNIFLPGRYVKVAIAPNGSFGSTVALPSGYYSRSPSIYAYDPGTGSGTSSSSRLAMIYDAGHDGWTTGSPAFFGDYTLPGTPYEGWQVEINGSVSTAWYHYYTSFGATGFSGTLSGNNTSYSNTGGMLKGVWQGTAGSGGTLSITQTTALDTNASWMWITTTFKNTGSSALTNVYYSRNFDPDNDQTTSSSFSTTNTINYQNDAYHRVMVTAAGTSYTTQTVSLATKDCRAKCFSSTGSAWPTGGTSPSTYYSGSASSTIYSGSVTGDNAMGLVFNLGTIAPGDSTSISYAFIFNGTTGVDSAYAEPLLLSNGVALDSVDTIAPCSSTVDTVFLNIVNGRTDNWSRSSWTWAPSTYLMHDTGISNAVYSDSLTGPITYTVTGTDTAYGRCSRKVYVFTVFPAVTPLPGVADVHVCLNATPVPLTATGSGLLWYNTPTGGTGSATAPVPSTSVARVDTYYVSQTLAGCPGGRARMIVYIDNIAGPINGPTAVCEASSITVSNDTLGGTWSVTPAGVATVVSSTGLLTGLTAGTAYVTYTRPGGCYVFDSVRVNPLPAAITGPAALCIGDTGILSTATSGGSWVSSNTAVASITSTTGVVRALSAGTTLITYTLPTGCLVTDSLVVNALPTAPTGGSAVCASTTLALSATPSGGVWTSSTLSVASVDAVSGLVYGLVAGSTTITYTVGSGCFSTLAVTVNPLPLPITGPSRVCEQSNVTLTSPTSGGAWSSNDATIATVNAAGQVTGNGRGSTTITYTNTTTGCYITTSITVDSLPDPMGGATSICENYTGMLTNAVPGGAWSTSASAIASINSTTGLAYGTSAGIALITYTLPTGCLVSDTLLTNPAPSGITGSTAVCAGGSTIALSETDPGGTWSITPTTIASVDGSGVVTGIGAGAATVSYTFTATGCPTVFNITVNPLPAAITGPGTMCIATSATFTSATTGGTWATSAASIASVTGTLPGTATAFAIASGNAIITYTLPTGCADTFSLSVNPLPSPVSGPAQVCVGSAITLASTTTGGGWSTASTGIATVNASGSVTGMAAGTATITYSLGTGCTDTALVTVNALPNAISGLGAVCQNSTTILSTTTPGGSWSTASASVASINASGQVYGVSPGFTTITYTAAATGCYVTHSITVNPLPAAITGTTSVCLGSITTLSDASSGGTWTTSAAPIASVIPASDIYGAGAGSATITYTLGTGCYTTVSVTVSAPPAAIAGPPAVCAGYSITLTNTTPGGTWVSGASAIASVDTATGIVFGLAAGSATISYIVTATGCFSTYPVTVNASPSAITGATSVCESGGTITLASATFGGTWSSSASTIASVDLFGTVTGVSAGTATITYTSSGCSVTAAITVAPLPGAYVGALSDTLLCPGGSVSLVAGTTTGSTYQWYNGGTLLTGATSTFYTTSTAGNYRIVVTSSYGCTSSSRAIAVTLNPATATITYSGPTTFCSGGSLALAANTGAGLTYQWLSGGAAISGATRSTYTATATGNYAVLVTNSSGCTATSAVVVISAVALPTTGVTASGPLTFCTGGSVMLTADSTTGASYQWQLGATNILGATNRSYTVTASGSYRIVISVGTCNATAALLAVTVVPPPSAAISVTGSTTFCTGGNVALSATSGTGYLYQWYNGGTTIPGATNANYSATATGNYSVRVTNSTGCSATTTAPVSVTEIGMPRIAAPAPVFCQGSSVTLSASLTSTTGTAYQWRIGGVDIAGATNSTYTTSIAGTYSYSVATTAGCNMLSSSLSVTERALPIPVVIYSGGRLRTTTNYTTYQWFRNGAAIFGATAYFINVTDTGHYAVAVTDSFGCPGASSIYFLQTLAVSPAAMTAEDIQVYPNPTTGTVHITSPGKVQAVLQSADGRILLSTNNTETIEIGQLATGVYVLQLLDGQGHTLKTVKLVKE